MQLSDIMGHVDHTVLSPDATWHDIRQCIDEAKEFGCACAMVPPCFVSRAVGYAGGAVPIATVVGFPHGNSTTAAKRFEAVEAVANGAAEIDMVANISWIKDGDYNAVKADIDDIKSAIGDVPLKVIIECSLLDEDEMREMCKVCRDAKAQWVKTSTGFSSGGATPDNVKVLCEAAEPPLQVKAAGGIKSIADAEGFLAAGATRLGTSRLVKIAKEQR